MWPTWLYTGSISRTLIRDIGEECAREGRPEAFKDPTNKTCQKELGSGQNWYVDPLPICFSSCLTMHASLQQHSATDGILTKWDTHWCKQTTQSISKQRVAFMVNHFLPFSLGFPHFFYPCLTVLKLRWGQNIRCFQPQLFYSFSWSTQHVSLPNEMCEMLLGSNYGLVKCYFSLPSECWD